MSDLYAMQATLTSVDYVSFTDLETFKGIAEWSDAHQSDVHVQRSEFIKGPKAYIVQLTDAQLSEAEWSAAFENGYGYVDVAGVKFYLSEGRRVRIGTSML